MSITIAESVTRLNQAKTDISEAITEMGGTVNEGDGFEDFSVDIRSIPTGGDSWYDTFWDNYQQNGERKTYQYAFSYSGWNGTTIKPKYPVKPTHAEYMFYTCGVVEDLTLCGDFDFSNAIRISHCFEGAKIKKIGVVDFKSATDWTTSTFRTSTLETIEKLISYPTNAFSSSFTNATALRNIEIEGVISKNFSIPQSPLTVGSMKSIITHLNDYAGTTDELKYTVTFNSTSWEALDAEGATSPNNNTWREYINDLGWNVG